MEWEANILKNLETKRRYKFSLKALSKSCSRKQIINNIPSMNTRKSIELQRIYVPRDSNRVNLGNQV